MNLRSKPVQLLWTSLRILRQQGGAALVRQTRAWLRGERGYHHRLDPDEPTYAAFLRHHLPTRDDLRQQADAVRTWRDAPIIELLTYSGSPAALLATFHSLQRQSNPHWRWSVVGTPVSKILDSRVTWITPTADALNHCLRTNSHPFIALIAPGDLLTHDALYHAAAALQQPDVDIVYSDSETTAGTPFFKPDWSPEMMLSVNLLDALGVFRRTLLLDVAIDPANTWALALDASRAARRIVHLPRILYQRRTPEPFDRIGIQAALERHLSALGLRQPRVDFTPNHPIRAHAPLCTWAFRPRAISIIIPTRDHPTLIDACLHSLLITVYPVFEVIVVDTGSTDPAAFAVYARHTVDPRVRVISDTAPFNFSRVCNVGARHARGDLLLFLNNDTQVLDPAWLTHMAQWFELPEVGIVGAKLLFPDGAIQHAGVIVGVHQLADNFMPHLPENSQTIFGSDGWYRNFLAVTGACLLIRRAVFEQVGGFDERYQLNFSDVQLGLDVHAAGYRIVYTPHARLLHHESMTHRRRVPQADIDRGYQQVATWVRDGDPYFNPNLNLTSPRPLLRAKYAP